MDLESLFFKPHLISIQDVASIFMHKCSRLKENVYMMKIENESKVYLTTKSNFSMHSFDIKMNYRNNLPALIINVIILEKFIVRLCTCC